MALKDYLQNERLFAPQECLLHGDTKGIKYNKTKQVFLVIPLMHLLLAAF